MSAYSPLDADADPFRPPAISTIVGCLHCREEYDSYLIEWRVEADSSGRPHGFWCCPTENCGGRGFGFDIFPVDPDYRDENGDQMRIFDDEEDECCLDDETDSSSGPKNGSDRPHNNDGESLPW